MLHCTMTHLSENLRLGLEDLLADLWHARRSGDLGRLALIFFSDVRRWARMADRQGLAQRASDLVTECPHASRASFVAQVDTLIAELEVALGDADGQPPSQTCDHRPIGQTPGRGASQGACSGG
jgi:hypothetical protein